MNPTVTISPAVPHSGLRSVTVLLGPTPPAVVADGGWVVVGRPKNSGFTVWEGYAPHTMNLDLLFDGWLQNMPQDIEYASLQNLMRMPVGEAQQPSPVRVTGSVPMPDLLWVIQGIEQDAGSVLLSGSGELLRASVRVSLLEYVQADVLSHSSPALRYNASKVDTGSPKSSGKTYTFKEGDSLWSIAHKELGAGKRYTEIVDLNNLRDPNRVPVGTVLKLP